MASRKKPAKISVRSYQVGFGDCFLLSFDYGAKHKHVLIDFGTTGLKASKKKRAGSAGKQMLQVAKDIEQFVNKTGELVAVVATHRHADHISGFATKKTKNGSGDVIRGLKPRLILQPWTEDPRAQRNARRATTANGKKAFLKTLSTMNNVASQALAIANANPKWMSATAKEELRFLGEDNIANKSAVTNLIAMGKAAGAKPKYLRYGDKTGLERLLPGVKVHVLGPPDLTQSDAIRTQRARDQDEFWQLRGDTFASAAPLPAPLSAGIRIPAQARWFRDRLQGLTSTSVLEIVRQLDDQMNNTSLILLFEVNGKKLLFPGDAQLENWSYALKEAKNSAKVRKLLKQVDFYKVGHHGSLNATPRQMLWEKFAKRGPKKKLKTMMSTMLNKHGSTRKHTEVPRKTLLQAMHDESTLQSTHLMKKKDGLFLKTEV